MPRRLVLLLLVSLAPALPAEGQSWAGEMFETTTHDFGAVARRAKAEYEFVLTNPYLEDVHVASARSTCGCTIVTVKKPLLKTYEKGAIVATLNTGAFLGQRSATITVTFDQPNDARVQLHVKGYIRDDVVLEPNSVRFGAVDHGTPVEKTISVSRRGQGNWRILEARSRNPHLSGQVLSTTRHRDRVSCQVRVCLSPDSPAAVIREYLELVTTDRRFPVVPVLVEGEVISGVTVSPAALFIGVVRPGQQVTRQLVVRGKEPFRIASVTSQGGCLKVSSPASDQPKPIHVIPVTFVAGQHSGKAVQTIHIDTDSGAGAKVAAFAVVQP